MNVCMNGGMLGRMSELERPLVRKVRERESEREREREIQGGYTLC